MIRTRITKIAAAIIAGVMAINLTGCNSALSIRATRLEADGSLGPVTPLSDLSEYNPAVTDFAVRLFKAGYDEDKNTLISPLSVLCALSLTANGANGDTLAQMEDVLGMPVDSLNDYIYSYMNSLPQEEKCKLSLANSIWFTNDERFEVNRDFLQKNADYYDADIYSAPFDDSTCKDINKWVKDKTDGMIPEILDEIPPEAVMYLVNALAFDAEWAEIYKKDEISDGEFTKEDGTKQKVEFMHSSEPVYLENDMSVGFMKYYKNSKYAFAALLPDEGISLSEFVASLDGKAISEMFANAKHTNVPASIPKFETKYDVEMSGILSDMGMPDAFDSGLADFKGLGTSTRGNICINRVLHKTFISVDEKGTKAGAATVVEVTNGSAMLESIDPIVLDRPFVYMLVDCENNLPFFIGAMTDIEK